MYEGERWKVSGKGNVFRNGRGGSRKVRGSCSERLVDARRGRLGERIIEKGKD